MLGIRNINPMARAIGTMGAIAALVGGVTYASLQSNTVALNPNTLTAASGTLQIGSNSEPFTSGSVTGMTATLTPGVASDPFTFYLKNTGDVPLNITANVPTTLGNSDVPADQVNLTFNCGSGDVTFSLAAWAAGSATIPGSPLGNGQTWTCTETATLNGSYSDNSGKSVKAFKVNFVGNQVANNS